MISGAIEVSDRRMYYDIMGNIDAIDGMGDLFYCNDERVKMNVTDGTGSVLTRYYLGGRYELDVSLVLEY